ncbi:MAG: hypothetical protein JXC32_14955 [Anaerolineae bacterium]|nr:hypothetical protein [Anaerolineae bacterium]
MSEEPEMVNEVPVEVAAPVGGTTPRDAGDAPSEGTDRPRGKVTFRGNTYDLSALGAFAGGILVLVSCLTCGQAFYCLPVIPLILGLIGLVMAKDAVDEERTRLWSWLGIGGSGLALLFLIFAVFSYFAFIALIVLLSQT